MTLIEKVQSLLTAANATTGTADTDLTSAVQRLINGYGGGSLPNNVYAGSITSPSTQYDTLAITTGFAPKIVGAYVHDDVNNLDTYTVVYGITNGNQSGVYFQQGGFTRTYTANNTTGAARGHIIGTSSTGFTFQTCEPYFANKQVNLIAIG